MKTLTLRQPWASLVAMGSQTIVTRARSTSHRGNLVIHSGVTPPDEFFCTSEPEIIDGEPYWMPIDTPLGAVVGTCELVDVVPIRSWAPLAGPPVTAVYAPRSCFEEPMILVRDEVFAAEVTLPPPGTPTASNVSDQLDYGDFTPGRYAWLLSDSKPTTERCPLCWGTGTYPPMMRQVCALCRGKQSCEPVQAKGRQGLWEWSPFPPSTQS